VSKFFPNDPYTKFKLFLELIHNIECAKQPKERFERKLIKNSLYTNSNLYISARKNNPLLYIYVPIHVYFEWFVQVQS